MLNEHVPNERARVRTQANNDDAATFCRPATENSSTDRAVDRQANHVVDLDGRTELFNDYVRLFTRSSRQGTPPPNRIHCDTELVLPLGCNGLDVIVISLLVLAHSIVLSLFVWWHPRYLWHKYSTMIMRLATIRVAYCFERPRSNGPYDRRRRMASSNDY